jgi:CheY-like chemotaxis protein
MARTVAATADAVKGWSVPRLPPVEFGSHDADFPTCGYACCFLENTILAFPAFFPMKFLIVDDNRQLTQCIAKYFREKGHRSASLGDSAKVLGWLAEHSCDAVILDIRMPKICGIELTKLVREKFPALPILMLTGVGYDDEYIRSATAAGANGYVSKVMGPSFILMNLLRIIGMKPIAETVAAGK